jgi:hypothetical protein
MAWNFRANQVDSEMEKTMTHEQQLVADAIAYVSTIPMDGESQQDALTILNIAIETLFAE